MCTFHFTLTGLNTPLVIQDMSIVPRVKGGSVFMAECAAGCLMSV